MKSCCLKCRKDTENVNPRVPGTSNDKTKILWKYATCGSKKSRFMKNQEGKALLSNLALRTPLHKVQILGSILFWGATSFNSNDFFFNQKNFTLFLIGGLFIYLFIYFCLFKWSIHNVVSTLSNVVKIDTEKYNVVSRLSNAVLMNVENRQRWLDFA